MDDILRPVLDNGKSPSFQSLFSQIKGNIIRPEHAEYDQARALAHNNWDHKPALIVRVADAQDVATTLNFARANQIEIAIRSGGHSTCGHGSCSGGIVIDLRDLRTLSYAEDKSWVWADAGLTAGEVTLAVEQHKMIVGFGDAASVGIGGLTLGGGIGYLVRKHGLTIDSVLAIEVVTADGEILIADEVNHPDLFWALRGGGGNFGVVTRFKYRLNPLPEFVGGPLVLPATAEVLAGFAAVADAAPDELSTIAMVMPAPPMPFLPPEVIGQTVLIGMMAYSGPASQADAVLAPFRGLATPIADLVGPAPYSAMYMPEDPALSQSVSIRTTFMDGVDIDQAQTMLDLLEQGEAPVRMVQVRVLGGAAARVPAEATAFGHRDSRVMTVFIAIDRTEAIERNNDWVEKCLGAFAAVKKGAYVNFLADEGAERIRDAYPEATWSRLQQVKRRYDPHNLFHRNQNVAPSA